MKGDFSRRTFDATKHYTAVLVEQGRMLTDADSEEEHRILQYRAERETRHIVGACGVPAGDDGFTLDTDSTRLRIGRGSFYAGGTLLENEDEIDFTEQPHRHDVPWPLAKGRHAIVLDSWRRLVTALDDPSIREVALGGPTTSAREQVVWQVRALPVAKDWKCGDPVPPVEVSTGELAARAEPDAELPSPCLIPPQAGFTGLENQFYRVEIFRSGAAYDLAAAPGTVTVSGFPAGRSDQVIVASIGALAVGTPIEVFRGGVNDAVDATFAHITAIDGTTLTLSVALPAFGPGDNPRVRPVDAVFVASRDNGCITTAVNRIDGADVYVHDLGPDDVLGFAPGQLVELSDDRVEWEDRPRQLRQVASVDVARRVVVLRTPADPLEPGGPGVNPDRHPVLRRWDAAGAVRFRPAGDAWIHLENGVQVRFSGGLYSSGDHWSFPARAATVDAESGVIAWPSSAGTPRQLTPHGIRRHRCVLGHIDVTATGKLTGLTDCRSEFPPLTAMRNLLYVGGDGQDGRPADASGGFIPLPGILAVRVVNGALPVAGATVEFTIQAGGGRLVVGAGAGGRAITDPQGLATCRWELDTTTGHQLCQAQLLTGDGTPVTHQIVQFHATVDADSMGCCHSIGVGGDYPNLNTALKDLIGKGVSDICLCLMPGDHDFPGGGFEPDEKRPHHLSIHGCGRGSRLRVANLWRLAGFAALRLTDFDLLMARDAELTIVEVGDVELRDLRATGMPPDGSGLVRVYGSKVLQVTGNVLRSRTKGLFEGPKSLFNGMGVLESPWDEDVLDQWPLINRAALELNALKAEPRRTLVADLRTRISDLTPKLPAAEIDAARRLTDSIELDPRPAALGRELDLVLHAALTARPGIALEIGQREGGEPAEVPAGGSIVIADNVVPGIVSFYGRAQLGSQLSPNVLKALETVVGDKLSFAGTAGEVHIRDNYLGQLAIGELWLKLLNDFATNPRAVTAVYESLHLTNNVIDGVLSETLARHTTLSANDFTMGGLVSGVIPANLMIAHVIGDTATYTGNHSRRRGQNDFVIRDVTRTSAEAANLEIHIG